MTRLRRALTGILMALTATAGVLTVAQPASAAIPDYCAQWNWDDGREVHVTNNANGGGASVDATICMAYNSDGTYISLVVFEVTDTKANGAGATIRMEWADYDGTTHYDVPIEAHRAWSFGETVNGDWRDDRTKTGLFVRACLTNTASEAHHCGGKA
jgi:hypothetical protein